MVVDCIGSGECYLRSLFRVGKIGVVVRHTLIAAAFIMHEWNNSPTTRCNRLIMNFAVVGKSHISVF